MRKLSLVLLLTFAVFSTLSVSASIYEFNPDKIYSIQMDGYALADMGEAKNVDNAPENEKFTPNGTTCPTLRTYREDSHAQLWECEVHTDGSIVLKNCKTGRYIWTDYQLPQVGKTWSEAAASDTWNILPSTDDIESLYMGPNASSVGLIGVNNFRAYVTDGELPTTNKWVFPTKHELNAYVAVATMDEQPTEGWSLKEAFCKDELEQHPDTGEEDGSRIDELVIDNNIRILGNKVIVDEPCCIYSTVGQLLTTFKGELTLSQGIYLIRTACVTHKIIIN